MTQQWGQPIRSASTARTSTARLSRKIAAQLDAPADLAVRLGTPADAYAIADIGARMFAATHTAAFTPYDMATYVLKAFAIDHLRADLADPATRFLVAHLGERLCGFLRLHPDPAPSCVTGTRPVELGRFYLDRPWIGRGVGKLLMKRALAQAASDDYDSVWLHVWNQNTAAIDFYTRWNFTAICSHEAAMRESAPCILVMERKVEVIDDSVHILI
jgi:ribosomal protein S18 acetylase RimI-like enzyme